MDEMINECHPVLMASELYADVLNSTSMSNHIIRILDDGGKRTIKVAPYCYFHTEFVDYEPEKGEGYSNELLRAAYPDEAEGEVNLADPADIVGYVVPTYKSLLPGRGRTFTDGICGLIGVPIQDINDFRAPPIGDHYVSYVYKGGVLNYFDSAIDGEYKDTETYKILLATFNPDTVIVNKKTFETAGGISENPYTYVAQNIFCHTWSLWFLYQFVVKGHRMKTIDNMASKSRSETMRSKQHLILIKTFVFKILIPKLQLKFLMDLTLFDAFRYIIINADPNKVKEIIKYE